MLKPRTEYDDDNIFMVLTEEVNICGYTLAFKASVITSLNDGTKRILLNEFAINDGYLPVVKKEDKPFIIQQLNSWMDELISLASSMKLSISLLPYDERAARLWARYGFISTDDGYMIRN